MTTQDRAAKALDLTHFKAHIGTKTEVARWTLACWLDGAIKMRASTVRAYCVYLEMIARA